MEQPHTVEQPGPTRANLMPQNSTNVDYHDDGHEVLAPSPSATSSHFPPPPPYQPSSHHSSPGSERPSFSEPAASAPAHGQNHKASPPPSFRAVSPAPPPYRLTFLSLFFLRGPRCSYRSHRRSIPSRSGRNSSSTPLFPHRRPQPRYVSKLNFLVPLLLLIFLASLLVLCFVMATWMTEGQQEVIMQALAWTMIAITVVVVSMYFLAWVLDCVTAVEEDERTQAQALGV